MGDKKKKTRNRFIAVDVWRPVFGDVSVKAINEIYKKLTQQEDSACRKTSLRIKVDFLRTVDNPDYKPVSNY